MKFVVCSWGRIRREWRPIYIDYATYDEAYGAIQHASGDSPYATLAIFVRTASGELQ